MHLVDGDLQIAILAVPEHSAQQVASTLVEAGIRGILNFAPIRLDIGESAEVTSVDVSRSLEQLTYQVAAAGA